MSRQEGSLEVGSTLDHVFSMMRSSFFSLLWVMVLVWASGVGAKLMVPTQFSVSHLMPALTYLFLMLIIMTSSAWIFNVFAQKEMRIYQGWRAVVPLYLKQSPRYIAFYLILALALMIWMQSLKSLSVTVGHNLGVIAGIGALYGLCRALLIMPVLSQGEGLVASCRRGLKLGQGQAKFLVMHMTIMVFILMGGLFVLALFQTLLFYMFNFNDAQMSDHTIWLQATSGFSVFFTLPFIHAYVMDIAKRLSIRQNQAGSVLCQKKQ